jgi:hypothetical protein
MAKKTSSKKSQSAAEDAVFEEPLFVETNLNPQQQGFLLRTCRFLVNVLTPGFADRARREGYSTDEHALGWRLWKTAAGETRPFEHWMSEQQLADGIGSEDAEQQRLLGEVDVFENTWFPRTRAIIRRVVPRDRRDAFAAAFFKDLKQQPLGPAVVGSVTTFVTRVEGLDKSGDADAKNVRAMLRARGLTPARMKAIKELLERAQIGTSPSRPKSTVSAEDLEKARTSQLEAYEDLRDWFNDWATTLRSRFGTRDQIRLGLTVVGGGGGSDTEGEPTEPAGDEPGAGAVPPAPVTAASGPTPPATT